MAARLENSSICTSPEFGTDETIMVSQEVRDIEREIDLFIENLPIWSTKRDVLLTRLMEVWRDGLEVVALMRHGKNPSRLEFQLERSTI